jgi:hypothetical protein
MQIKFKHTVMVSAQRVSDFMKAMIMEEIFFKLQ